MGSVGAYEAKTHLPKLLKRVAEGEKIIITKHGVPVAILQPPPSLRNADTKEVIENIKAFRKGRQLGGLSLQKIIAEGRR